MRAGAVDRARSRPKHLSERSGAHARDAHRLALAGPDASRPHGRRRDGRSRLDRSAAARSGRRHRRRARPGAPAPRPLHGAAHAARAARPSERRDRCVATHVGSTATRCQRVTRLRSRVHRCTRDRPTAASHDRSRRSEPFHPPDHRQRPRRRKARRPRRDALSARAERLPAPRPREVDLPQLRSRARVRRQLRSALRRHQSGQGRTGIRRGDQERRATGSASTGTTLRHTSDYFEVLVPLRRKTRSRRQGIRLRSLGRRGARVCAAR